MTNNYFEKFEYNPNHVFSGLVVLFLVLISSVGAPKVPQFLVTLFNNTVFKILYMTLLLIVFKYKPMVAFFMALIFLLVLQTINNYHDYIEHTTDKLNVHNLTKGLVNSASDAVSEVLSDTESIFTSVKSAVVDVANYADKPSKSKNTTNTNNITNPTDPTNPTNPTNPKEPFYFDENMGSDSFEPNNEHFYSNLSPMVYEDEKDLYNGPQFKYSIGLDSYDKSFTFGPNSEPLNQFSGIPAHDDPLLSNENSLKSLHGAYNAPSHLHPHLQLHNTNNKSKEKEKSKEKSKKNTK